MKRLVLGCTLAAVTLAVLCGCNTRNNDPVTVPHHFFDKKRLPPKPSTGDNR